MGVVVSRAEFSFQVRVYYEDTDAGGIVYYANYLKFFERARTEWFRELGVDQAQLLAQNIAFVVRHVEMDNRRAAKFNQLLTITSRISQLKKASLIFQQTLTLADGLAHGIDNLAEQTICTAQFKVACIDNQKMKPIPIPLNIIEVLEVVR